MLPSFKAINLQVIDLSGSTTFREFQDTKWIMDIQILNLSGTQIVHLPDISLCRNLRQLLLRGCSVIETLPYLGFSTSLEVIDLSGATAFKEFKDEYFWNSELRILNLAKTQVLCLPSFSRCKSLCHLLLRGCLKLEELPPLVGIICLQVIDLAGAMNFKKFQDESLGQKYDLRILNLSGTQVVQLPSLSKCNSLSQLLLRGCSKLEKLPNLEALTELTVIDLAGATALRKIEDDSFKCMNQLEKLDLSGVPIKLLPSSISNLSNLPHLILKGCPNIEEFPHRKALMKLEALDIPGTKISNLPRKYLSSIDWGSITKIPEELAWEPCSGSNSPNEKLEDCGRPCIHVTVSNTDIFHFIEKNFELWETCFQRFHICLCPVQEQWKDENIYVPGKEFVVKDFYIQTRHFQETKEPERFLEIRGIHSFPSGIEEALNRVEVLFLKNSMFVSRLSDLRIKDVKVMRECWIERCNEMESAFYGEETKENMALGRNLEKLWFSNAARLRSLWTGLVQPESFKCLKHLYIDCCPRLVTISSRGLLLENLETLQIKFCDQFENLFEEMVFGEHTLPRLQKLTLWQLQKLESICGGVLHSLQKLKVKGCPKLRKLPLDASSMNSLVEIKGEMIWWNNLTDEDKSIRSHPRFIELRRFL